MSREYFIGKIDATKTLIDAYEAALLALAENNATQQYTLDTGQSRQTVVRADIPKLNDMLDILYNRLSTLETRIYGGVVTVRPAW